MSASKTLTLELDVLNNPASTNEPVPVPAGNVAENVDEVPTASPDDVATLANSFCNAV